MMTVAITSMSMFFEYPFENAMEPEQYIKQYNYHFITILPKKKGLHWAFLKQGIKKADQELNIVTEVIEAKNNEKQLELLKMAIASDVDGIITCPMEDKEYTPVINDAVQKGIPVITVSTDAPESHRNSFIGANKKSGESAAREFLVATKGQANICILITDQTSFTYMERLKGFQSVIKEHPKMKIVTVAEIDNDLLLSTEKVKAILEKEPDINAIFCVSSNNAIAAAKAVSAMKREDILIMGYDDFPETLEYIEKGIIYGTITQKSNFIGYLAVKYLRDIRREKWVPNSMDPGIILVTNQNIKEYQKRRGDIE
jgi:ribose transport system substrate-binding protein